MSTTTSHGPDRRDGGPRVAIIGSGFAGLGAAITLREEAGVDDLVILERGESVGGTWRDNHYPGAACDIPAHLYSFSFEPKADWSTHYPRQAEIRDYLEHCADAYGLRDHLRLATEVVGAAFDEPSATWTLTARDGRTFTADALIVAVGPLSDPKIPDLPGREDFAGTQFHSARWDHGADLSGARIGAVGTGASAIQFVPHLAEQADRLHVFQRSAPWILPRVDRRYTALEKAAFAHVPGLRAAWRQLIYLQKELRFAGFGEDSPAMRAMEQLALWHMRRSVSDPGLRAKLTPDYAMGCKRILIHNEYYPAVARDHVEVVTDPIERIEPAGLRTASGRRIDLDVLVWGTGFTVHDPLGALQIRGLGGRSLDRRWGGRPSAHLGTTVPGFPNLFVVLGPNTGLGHNSMIYMMEAQFSYIVDAVRRLADPRVAYLDVREQALSAFEDEVTDRNEDLVWSSGCRSWYLGDDGHNVALWPGWTFEYRRRTRTLDEDRYRVVGVDELPRAEEPLAVR